MGHLYLDTLTTILKSFLGNPGLTPAQVDIIERKPNAYTATFPCEIITCRVNGNREIKIFCKHGGNHPRNVHDQEIPLRQGGVPYEAKVYRHVLLPHQLSTITYYGDHHEKETDTTWLFLEHLEESVHASNGFYQVEAMSLAARWLGNFHRICEDHADPLYVPFLRIYNEEYYLKWPERTKFFAKDLNHIYPWLSNVCDKSQELVHLLFARPLTIIHGDFYTDNILFREGKIYPIDWGWSAIATGENDLATLTERWPSHIVEQCELEYQQTRWPQGVPADFLETLNVARLYNLFRWLGDKPERTLQKENKWRFDNLYNIAKYLELINE